MNAAEQLLAAGQPQEALAALQQQVRANAGDVRLRIFLFQLLAVLGQWPRALQQLAVCGEMDAGTLAMVNTYTPALQCEALRDAVFAGRAAPHVFGPPAAWVAQLVQALQLDAAGHPQRAALARAQALDDAPASSGQLDGQPFAWIADADGRLGPVLEVIINGRYGWLPFMHLQRLRVEPVADLRDLVWAPAQLMLANGGETVALLPVRYAGSAAGDAAQQLARRTDWLPLDDSDPTGPCRGLGQRLLATDAGDAPLLALRELLIDTPPATGATTTPA